MTSLNVLPASPAVVLSTIDELSKKIKRAKSTIYSDLNRNPQSLPPTLKIPGSGKVLFVNADLWLLNLAKNQGVVVIENGVDDQLAPAAKLKKKRGRKSNAEKMALGLGL